MFVSILGKNLSVFGFFILLTSNVGTAKEAIRLNQIGFYPKEPKFAVAVASASEVFYITSPDQTDTLFTSSLGNASVWSHSGEFVRLLDFTAFEMPGEYTILIPDLGQSHPFRIADYVHQGLATAVLKNFYFQRASLELTQAFAGSWSRPAGHHDTQVYIHASAATEKRPTDTIISSSRGWYDAGDYNKYIVNSGISTYTILAAYEHFPDYYQSLVLTIPESGNGIPDILNEALWNIRWMLTMQDPDDGGVYHKLTTANFSGAVMPHQATARRYVVQKSTAAALDFAAVMAQASRIFENFSAELPGLSDSCLTAGLGAWKWARENPDVLYNQGVLNSMYDPDINTGSYGDWNCNDEFQWASAELLITTKADSFIAVHDPLTGGFELPWWGGVNTLGLYSLAHHRGEVAFAVDTAAVAAALLNLAQGLRAEVNRSAYHVVMGESNGDFVWGSNGVAANQGMALIQAYNLTGDSTFLSAALQNLDYLAGRNGTGYCFVTGFGEQSPMHPHHRPSQADDNLDPVPGLLVGGPNPNREDGAQGYIGTERARAYADVWPSYASNENAINWNAAIVYLTGAIEALNSSTGLPNPTSVRGDDSPDDPMPDGFGLYQNFPNPFNSTTQLHYILPIEADVQLGVYNLSGQLIRLLQNHSLSAGSYTISWDANTDADFQLTSGIYVARLVAHFAGHTVVEAKKMLMLK